MQTLLPMAVLGPVKAFKGGIMEKERPGLFREHFSALSRGPEFRRRQAPSASRGSWIMGRRYPWQGGKGWEALGAPK